MLWGVCVCVCVCVCVWGVGGRGWGMIDIRSEGMQKKQSPVFRFPEVGISGLCTTTIVQTLSLL